MKKSRSDSLAVHSTRTVGVRTLLLTWAGLTAIIGLGLVTSSGWALADDQTIKIANFTFVPPTLTVKAGTKVTWVNTATSGSLAAARLPMHYPSDRACLEILSQTVESAPEDATMGWIRNSLELGEFAFSENLRAEIEANPALEIVGPPFDLDFDDSGNLMASPVPTRLH